MTKGKKITVDILGAKTHRIVVPDSIYLVKKVHGFFGCVDESFELAIAAQNEWVKVTNSDNTLFADIQTNAGIIKTDDTFKLSNNTDLEDIYKCHLRIDFKLTGHGGNNVDWECQMYNATQEVYVPVKTQESTRGANNRTTFVGIAYDMNSQFGDVYEMRLRNTTNATNFTIENAAIFMDLAHLVVKT
jgi:hypothetical protein